MDCSSCKDRRAEPVPFIVHESAMARAERTIKRLWIIAIILILLLAGTNGAWIWYESQWEVVETEVSQEVETGNGDAIVSGTGGYPLWREYGRQYGRKREPVKRAGKAAIGSVTYATARAEYGSNPRRR